MPDDEARKQAGERLAADLRTLREERGLSAGDVQKHLQVPNGLFEAFEKGRLLGHPMFNRVYLRSLTRSYAEAVGVPSSAALSALQASLEGNYEKGQLRREIEDHESPARPEPSSSEGSSAEEAARDEEASEEPPRTQEPSSREETEGQGAVVAGEAAGTTASQEQAPDWTTQSPPGASAEEAERRHREKEERAQQRQHEREARAQQQEHEREERTQHRQEGGAQRHERRSAERSRRRRERSSSKTGAWIVGGLIVAVLAVGAFFLLRGGSGDTETVQTPATVADTAADGTQESEQQDQRPAADLQLGETMHFTVVAQGGPVRDLKVTRDEDVRRPYWIEEGQATVFPARQRIIIENPPEGEPVLDDVRLLAEGYPYPTARRDAQGRIVITRQDMQAFADTLRGQSVQPPAQRDTASLPGQ